MVSRNQQEYVLIRSLILLQVIHYHWCTSSIHKLLQAGRREAVASYSIKCFRKLLSYCGPKKYHALNVFIDTFQGHNKDDTNGTRDYRAASYNIIISFILRIPVYYFLIDILHFGMFSVKYI